MNLIWVARGRSWGFRFLLDGGHSDPLPAYEQAFSDMEVESVGFRRAGQSVAVRFPDPLDRRDAAGRVIPHDFVVPDSPNISVDSVADGLRKIWPLVEHIYERVWCQEAPPLGRDIQSAFDDGPAPAPCRQDT